MSCTESSCSLSEGQRFRGGLLQPRTLPFRRHATERNNISESSVLSDMEPAIGNSDAGRPDGTQVARGACIVSLALVGLCGWGVSAHCHMQVAR